MVHHFPVMLWKSHAGTFAGRLLDADNRGSAVGPDPAAVLAQLAEFVTFFASNDWLWEIAPDLKEVQFRQIKVPVVPEYRIRNRTFPSKESIVLKLPCAVGRRETGLYAAIFPTVDVVFDFGDPEGFPELARHYVRNALAGLSPREIARYLPPERAWIEDLAVEVNPPDERPPDEGATSPLGSVAEHIGERALRTLSRTWERSAEVADMVQRLSDNTASICLVGAAGCGKTSILVEAARRVERAMREKGRRGARAPKLFWMTSAGRLVAGMRYLGQWEDRLENVIDELAQLEGILCVENLLELVRLGGSGPETSLGAFLIPYLEHNELRLVTEATAEEVEACERLLPGLIDQLQILKVEPFTDEQARSVIHHAGSAIGTSEGVAFTPPALDTAFELFRRFLPYTGFPGRAVHFLGESADAAARGRTSPIGPDFIRDRFGRLTGLPRRFIDDSERFDVDEAAASFDARVLGQSDAVRSVCESLAKFKAGINDPARPLAVLLFSGPTGVGKTALVRALGDYLFGEKPPRERLVRLDMSEYASYDAPMRLLGDPFGEPSDLVRRIRANPFTVLLLDEIEKASEEVFDIFLNVFEEGRLTDTYGRVTHFQSTLIVMTSNLGSGSSGPMGFSTAVGDQALAGPDPSVVKRFFRPEFYNRLDRVVSFSPLPPDIVFRITENELRAISEREGITSRGLRLDFADDLVASLARDGFDPKFGARPLQRRIEERVTIPLARRLMAEPDLRERRITLLLDRGETVLEVE